MRKARSRVRLDAARSWKPSRARPSLGEAPRRQPTQYNSLVAHLIEPASSGRAKCRSCDQPIAKGELRFGERQPNAFGDGEMTLWFHLPCGAYSRPEPFLEAQGTRSGRVRSLESLAAAARFGIEHRRVPRLHGAERASSGPRTLPQLPRADRQGRVAAAARILRGLSVQSRRLHPRSVRAQLLRDGRLDRPGSALLAGAARTRSSQRSRPRIAAGPAAMTPR